MRGSPQIGKGGRGGRCAFRFVKSGGGKKGPIRPVLTYSKSLGIKQRGEGLLVPTSLKPLGNAHWRSSERRNIIREGRRIGGSCERERFQKVKGPEDDFTGSGEKFTACGTSWRGGVFFRGKRGWKNGKK